MVQLPDAPEAQAMALDRLFDELEQRIGRYTNRMPRLKIFRVLAGFFPSDFNNGVKLQHAAAAPFGHVREPRRQGAGLPRKHPSETARNNRTVRR